MKINLILATSLLGVVAGTFAFAAPPASNPNGPITIPRDGLTPKRGGVAPAITCQPDLTISRMALTRFGPTRSSIRVSIEVRNVGRGTFTSEARQAGASALVVHGATNARVQLNLGSITSVPAGRTVTLSDITADMPFDTFEFGGEASASINYDPDILMDGQPCNDDKNYANDRFAIPNDRIRAWLGTTSNSLIINR